MNGRLATSALIQCDDGFAAVVALDDKPDAPMWAAPRFQNAVGRGHHFSQDGTWTKRGGRSAEPSKCGAGHPLAAERHAARTANRAVERFRRLEEHGNRWIVAFAGDRDVHAVRQIRRTKLPCRERRGRFLPVEPPCDPNRTGSSLPPGCPPRESRPRDRWRFGLRPISENEQFEERVLEAVADIGGALPDVIATVGLGQAERSAISSADGRSRAKRKT